MMSDFTIARLPTPTIQKKDVDYEEQKQWSTEQIHFDFWMMMN